MEKVKGWLKYGWNMLKGHKTWIGCAIVAYVVPLIAPEAIIPLGWLGGFLTIKSIPLAVAVRWIGNALAGVGLGHKLLRGAEEADAPKA